VRVARRDLWGPPITEEFEAIVRVMMARTSCHSRTAWRERLLRLSGCLWPMTDVRLAPVAGEPVEAGAGDEEQTYWHRGVSKASAAKPMDGV
jgi:hypothetical protein